MQPTGKIGQRQANMLHQLLESKLTHKGGANRGARGAMAPLKIFLEGPGPSKITDDPSSVMNFYSTLYI